MDFQKQDFLYDPLSPYSCMDLYVRVRKTELDWVSVWISKHDFLGGPLSLYSCMYLYIRVEDVFFTEFQTELDWVYVWISK